MLIMHGSAYTVAQIKGRLYVRKNSPKGYGIYMKMSDYSEEELDAQRAAQFDESITFSILVPLYNTPRSFLVDMIESVRNQTCGDWQLCLADASDADHGEVGEICLDYAARDKRICYRKLETNLGISGNTNAAIEMAEGDYIALLDHDDVLHPAALFEMRRVATDRRAELIYTDEATFMSPDIKNIRLIHFKPDYAPDNLLANNYICHFMAFRKNLLEKTGSFRSQYDGSQDHDMVLRLTEVTDRIIHIPRVLYFWRGHSLSTAVNTQSKDYASRAGAQAVQDALVRRGIKADVTIIHPGIYRVVYPIPDTPKVSIIIPSCDHVKDLSRCLDSIREKSTYPNYEIIVVENNSKDPSTFSYYKKICKEWDRVRVIRWKGPFNYSAINNFAVKKTDAGPYLLLLNNDTEVINGGWIEEMLMHACRREVGAVGAKLYFPNDTVQHAGVILGMGGVAAHSFYRNPHKDVGYMGRMLYSQNYSAVTGACMMVHREVWDRVGGLDENIAVAYNDVDLCMRIRSADYLIVWTPWAELFHYESASRGDDRADS